MDRARDMFVYNTRWHKSSKNSEMNGEKAKIIRESFIENFF